MKFIEFIYKTIIKKINIGFFFVLPSLIGLIMFYIIPFFMSIYYSFVRGIYSSKFVGLKNYIQLFKSDSFLLACGNTVKLILIAIPILLVLTLFMAVIIDYLIKKFYVFTYRILTFFMLSIATPMTAEVLFIKIFFSKYGIINGILVRYKLSNVLWLENDLVFWLMIFLYIWKNFAMSTLIFLAGISQIDKSLFEAAKIDGANCWIIFRYITLNRLLPYIGFNILFGIINVFKSYRESYLLFGDYPPKSIYMLQNFLNNNFYNLNYQRLSSATIVFFVAIFIPIVIFTKNYCKAKEDFFEGKKKK